MTGSSAKHTQSAIGKHAEGLSFFHRAPLTEVMLYAAIVAYAAVHVIGEAMRLSSPSWSGYAAYASLLKPGWMLGKPMDLSDHQYRSFREGMPMLALALASYAGLNRLFRRSLVFSVVFNLAFLAALHGVHSLEIVALALSNFLIVKTLSKTGPRLLVPYTWTLAIGALVYFDYAARNAMSMIPARFIVFAGALPRWTVLFKVSLLRLMSYNLDSAGVIVSEHRAESCTRCVEGVCINYRMASPAKSTSFWRMLSYVFYPPLYLSGPIMTFHDFSFQQQQIKRQSVPWKRPSRREVLLYALRFLASFLVLEGVLHFMHVNAIRVAALSGNKDLTLLSYATVAFFNLKIVWLKLLVIWRFARLFALLDGLDPLENLLRCMSNNYSAQGFWRTWHCSFNVWITRYLYIPLGGGRRNMMRNLFVVFGFVALWHDVEWKLLLWGGLVPLFLLPELVFGRIGYRLLQRINRYFCRHALVAWLSRAMCGLGATFNICLMLTANTVGFCGGLEGVQMLLKRLSADPEEGLVFTGRCVTVIYAASQLMFSIRDFEDAHK
jgi:D-alanyl-lipoteichoic acid acyltransferase DltB (MBOAT superfamily)